MPTVADVLELPALRKGRPDILASGPGLATHVRWAHIAEIPDISPLLHGGELVFTTGIALPSGDAERRAFLDSLVEVPIAGLVIELGRVFTTVPDDMVAHAQERGLLLIALRRVIPFVDAMQEIHALVHNAHLSELQTSHDVHSRFTHLMVDGATVQQVLDAAAELSGRTVVLENLSFQALAHHAEDAASARVLERWESLSRRTTVQDRTGWDAPTGLLVSKVVTRGQVWARLVMVCPEPPSLLDQMVIERAAGALSVQHLVERDASALTRQTHGSILSALLDGKVDATELANRARALGMRLDGKRLVGAVMTYRVPRTGIEGQARLRELADAVAFQVEQAQIPALVAAIDDQHVGVLAAIASGEDDQSVLQNVSERMHRGGYADLITGAGAVVSDLRDAHVSLAEARHVVQAAQRTGFNGDAAKASPFLRIADLRVLGLLHLLADDPRVQTFVQRELGPILRRPQAECDELLAVLHSYFACAQNKAAAAAALHMSRPTLYERLARASRLLDANLADPMTALSLQVALASLRTKG